MASPLNITPYETDFEAYKEIEREAYSDWNEAQRLLREASRWPGTTCARKLWLSAQRILIKGEVYKKFFMIPPDHRPF